MGRIWMVAATLAAVAVSGCGAANGVFRDREALVTTPGACGTRTFEVYFDENEARLTSAARQAMVLTATQLQPCRIKHVRVTGLADARSGTAQSNLTLSQRRAMAVVEALEAQGWPAPAFDVGAVGDTGAAAGGINEPLRRRTEVIVEAEPR